MLPARLRQIKSALLSPFRSSIRINRQVMVGSQDTRHGGFGGAVHGPHSSDGTVDDAPYQIALAV